MKHILTVTGASGAGKDSLVDAILVLNGAKRARDCDNIAREFSRKIKRCKVKELISHSTRDPRPGEVDGITYYFVTEEEFSKLLKVEETEYAGKHYCLSENELMSIPDNTWGIVIVDQNGAKTINEFVKAHPHDYTMTSVFLSVDPYISKHRMEERGDSDESVHKRLMQQDERHEYSPKDIYFFDMVLNANTFDDFKDNVQRVQEVLYLSKSR